MKRIEQLQPLSKEHHQSLLLAHRAIKASLSQDEHAIDKLCSDIVRDFPAVWAVHFKIEEDSIFQPYGNKTREIATLCQQLAEEHQIMTGYYEQMKAGDFSVLGEFGILLKQHTRTEERQLFPLLTEVLSSNELDLIYQTSREYRY